MLELRWILLGMGIVLIGGLYLWSRNPFSISLRSKRTIDEPQRAEPSISGIDASGTADTESESLEAPTAQRRNKATIAERVVTLRLMGHSPEQIRNEQAILALRAAGLVHGRYGIFHCLPADGSDEPLFSVASLTEPGSFNVAELDDTTLPGMSFFMVLPGPEDPVSSFDTMIQVGRAVSKELDAELFDERGSSWSIQRERYIREEIIEFRHQLART
jgi:cell division protein ZipA